MDPFSGDGGQDKTSTGPIGGFETSIKPIDQPQGRKPKPKNPVATFMGSEATPGPASSNFGGKTLLGM